MRQVFKGQEIAFTLVGNTGMFLVKTSLIRLFCHLHRPIIKSIDSGPNTSPGIYSQAKVLPTLIHRSLKRTLNNVILINGVGT